MNTLDLLEIAAAIVPERPAFVDVDDRRLSFVELQDKSALLAGGLHRRGVQPGDRVAIMAVNRVEYPVACFACARLDAVLVPVNFRSRAGELSDMFESVEPSAVLADERYLELVEEAAGPDSVRVVFGEARAGWEAWDAISSGAPLLDPPGASDDDHALILFTSGATSKPKGVTLTHQSFCGFVMENVTPADPDSGEATILAVPLYHVAGIQSLMAGVYGGRTTVLQPQFDAEAWLSLVERHRVERAMLVPTMLKELLSHPRLDEFDLSSLRLITYGAAPMPEAVIAEAITRMPSVQFINAFGQTETAATITMLGPDDHDLTGAPDEVAVKRKRLRSIGRPLADVEVKIVDAEGAEAPAGQVGEIVARGPRVMKGYWGAPSTETVRDGWVYTGDLARTDEDGYIFLEGRAREFIKRGGEMISPLEVEEMLEAHPAVREAAVIGVANETWGETVHAVVALEKPGAASAEELIEHCRAGLASFKKPERVHFVVALPRNALGKVLRPQVREMLRDGG